MSQKSHQSGAEQPPTNPAANKSQDSKHHQKKWTVGDSEELVNGGRLIVDVGDKSVGIFRIEGQLYAYINSCCHMGGPVCQGKILPRVVDIVDDDKIMTGTTWDESDPQISCPWHGFEYSLKTGQHSKIKSISLKKVAVEEANGVIYVTV